MRKIQQNQGFALLFSVVVISVVVITTLAVSSLVRRGLELTTIGERSMEAFYAADAGLECALYWDIHERGRNMFPRNNSGVIGDIECLGSGAVRNKSAINVGSRRIYSFDIRQSGGNVCATVEVEIDGLNTIARSRGYNTCNSRDPERIERGLHAEY